MPLSFATRRSLSGLLAATATSLAERAYDLFLLCAPDLPFAQDGTRRDPAFRARQHDFYLAELQRRKARWLLVEGSLDARVRRARRAISLL